MGNILKISHISKANQLLEAISNFQSEDKCQVQSLLYNQSVDLTNKAVSETDILHIHGISLLEEPSVISLIKNRQQNGKVVIFSLFTDNVSKSPAEIFNENQNLLKESSLIFLQDTSLLDYLDTLENWSWSPAPVESNAEHTHENFEDIHTLQVLYFKDGNNDKFLETLTATVEKLKAENININLIAAPYTPDKLKNCDILIENPSLPAISYRSLNALALGKTVLANIPDNSASLSKQFEFSPILNTTSENVYYRLKSLAMQPKSLRDFGRRGLKYIQDYHNPKEICQSYMDMYRQFIPTQL